MSFAEFEQALEMVAEKKGKSKAAVVEQILQAGGPMSSGTRASSGGVLDRMTDTAQYTGSHKVRILSACRSCNCISFLPCGHSWSCIWFAVDVGLLMPATTSNVERFDCS